MTIACLALGSGVPPRCSQSVWIAVAAGSRKATVNGFLTQRCAMWPPHGVGFAAYNAAASSAEAKDKRGVVARLHKTWDWVDNSALSVPDNQACYGQGQQRQSDDREPERSLGRSSNRIADQKNDQQEKLHLRYPNNNSKHVQHPCFTSPN